MDCCLYNGFVVRRLSCYCYCTDTWSHVTAVSNSDQIALYGFEQIYVNTYSVCKWYCWCQIFVSNEQLQSYGRSTSHDGQFLYQLLHWSRTIIRCGCQSLDWRVMLVVAALVTYQVMPRRSYLGLGVTREAKWCVDVADVVRVDVPEVSQDEYLLFVFYRVQEAPSPQLNKGIWIAGQCYDLKLG